MVTKLNTLNPSKLQNLDEDADMGELDEESDEESDKESKEEEDEEKEDEFE